MRMVIDCINNFKEKTQGKLPIVYTDTQSPFDTATLVLDASEFFSACYTDEETVMQFMQTITDLTIEFSKEQMQAIGSDCLVKPGHIFPASTKLRGIALSDDNIAVASPDINERVAMPFNQQIADVFGGLAVHSCGNWSHTMPIYKNLQGLYMIDCALSLECDPNPNAPALVREGLRGSDVIAKVRVGKDMANVEKILNDLIVPDLHTIVQIEYEEGIAGENYKRINGMLEELYARKEVLVG